MYQIFNIYGVKELGDSLKVLVKDLAGFSPIWGTKYEYTTRGDHMILLT